MIYVATHRMRYHATEISYMISLWGNQVKYKHILKAMKT